MGNGEAKELIYIIHRHELRWGNDGGRGGYWADGEKKNKDLVIGRIS